MTTLLNNLTQLYGAAGQEIIPPLENYYHTLPVRNALAVRNPCSSRTLRIYTVYADGIVYDKQYSALQNIVHHLPYIKKLGCNALHLLPFLASPMRDKGFDVSDYLALRDGMGDQQTLDQLATAAQQANIALFMDLVLNHVSDNHLWFQRAQEGDSFYRNYFIHTAAKTEFIRKFHAKSAVWGEFNVDGQCCTVNLSFPEFTSEIPLWRQGKDGFWYYYTYYPYQLDLNWENPHVFLEIAKVVLYWGRYGFNFRLDALPFVGKPAYKKTDIAFPPTHLIVQSLRQLARQYVNPHLLLLAESYEAHAVVNSYFGNPDYPECDLSYNFHGCTSLWVALLQQKACFIWRTLAHQHMLPPHAGWLNFLRNHDELSLAHLPDPLAHEMKNKLLPYGEIFREGWGISGRSFCFLHRQRRRFYMAYFLLVSLPHSIMLCYGDEIGVRNIPLKKLSRADRTDTRNINRGVLTKALLTARHSQKIYRFFTFLMQQRDKYQEYFTHWPERLSAPAGIFAARYPGATPDKVLYVYINLSHRRISLNLSSKEILHKVHHLNKVSFSSAHRITLGAYGGCWLVTIHDPVDGK